VKSIVDSEQTYLDVTYLADRYIYHLDTRYVKMGSFLHFNIPVCLGFPGWIVKNSAGMWNFCISDKLLNAYKRPIMLLCCEKRETHQLITSKIISIDILQF